MHRDKDELAVQYVHNATASVIVMGSCFTAILKCFKLLVYKCIVWSAYIKFYTVYCNACRHLCVHEQAGPFNFSDTCPTPQKAMNHVFLFGEAVSKGRV